MASQDDKEKDPQAILDFGWDWKPKTHARPGAKKDWLAAGETITTYTVTVPPGINKTLDLENDGAVSVWLSGGTEDEFYTLYCKITTSVGRTERRKMVVHCTTH